MPFRHSSAAVLLAATVLVGWCAGQTAEPAGSAEAQVPLCEVGTGSGYFPSYIDDTFPQLKAAVPALRGLRVEEGSTTDESEKIVSETGAAIEAMLPRVPNLIAKEEVSQGSLSLPFMVSAAGQSSTSNYGLGRVGRSGSIPTGSGPGFRTASSSEQKDAMDGILNAPKNRLMFSYRIQSNPDAASGPRLREFRTNEQNETILEASTNAGNPRGVGFGSAWLMFEPANLNQFRFRYLGREKIGKHETVVFAFAQIPERAMMPTRISVGGTTCYFFVQGVVWIDPTIFQMIRLQTDLLAPLIGVHERKLRSEINFSEVRIPARNLTLWMPNRVELNWEIDTQAGAELHRYSDWRLFGSTSRILPADPE